MAQRQDPATAGIGEFAECFDAITGNVGRALLGKDDAIRLALICLVAEGHLLVEDVPGVGKTSLAKALSRSIGLEWSRIQFTPDLLPADVTGAVVYDRNRSLFEFRPGAVFANVVLGDEINRASPKTQSSLLEAMEERQVTVDGVSHRLPQPFMVIATQNPAEHEGTYPLPESQVDRFLVRLRLGYPPHEAEVEMLQLQGGAAPEDLPAVADTDDLAMMVKAAAEVYVAPPLRGYLVDLAAATRRHPRLELGMSPRATLSLQAAARARAASEGREYVVPDDIKAMAGPVVAHRLVLAGEADLAGEAADDILAEVVTSVAVPAAPARR